MAPGQCRLNAVGSPYIVPTPTKGQNAPFYQVLNYNTPTCVKIAPWFGVLNAWNVLNVAQQNVGSQGLSCGGALSCYAHVYKLMGSHPQPPNSCERQWGHVACSWILFLLPRFSVLFHYMCSPPSFKLHFHHQPPVSVLELWFGCCWRIRSTCRKVAWPKVLAYSKYQCDVRLYKFSYECFMAVKGNTQPKKIQNTTPETTHKKNPEIKMAT